MTKNVPLLCAASMLLLSALVIFPRGADSQYPPHLQEEAPVSLAVQSATTASGDVENELPESDFESDGPGELFVGADSGSFDGSSTLMAIEQTTGSSALIGEIGLRNVTDVATRRDGKLFGITFDNLLRIDCSTGAVDRIFRASGFPGMNALAFGPDGQLYAATVFGELLRIRPNTGKGTRIGFFGNGLGSAGDLAFSPEGRLYGTARRAGSTSDLLVSIDLRTGAATVVGRTRFRDVFGLVFGSDQRLYGIANGNPGRLPVLIRINTATGRGKRIGAIPGADGMYGMTSLCFS